MFTGSQFNASQNPLKWLRIGGLQLHIQAGSTQFKSTKAKFGQVTKERTSSVSLDSFAKDTRDQAFIQQDSQLRALRNSGWNTDSVQAHPAIELERVELQSSFPDRNGYDEKFLGLRFELPKVAPEEQKNIAKLLNDPSKAELEYTNFSVVMNKERRQAFYTAVNIDGSQIVSLPRRGRWTTDSRIAREHQLGNEAYKNNPIDRGHLVRRRDPVWGPDAELANSDSFVYTNSGLQHSQLNQKSWLKLENYILDQAKEKKQKLTVLTGPVFSDSDPQFDNKGRMDKPTKLPQEFWKVVVWNDKEDGLKAAAFIQSQKDYVNRSSLFKSDFDPEGMSLYQVPLEKLEEVTKLDFGEVKDSTESSSRVRDDSGFSFFN